MKLNYVSVKGYQETEDGLRICIRAELEEQPTRIWCKLFQLTWSMSQPLKTLQAEIQFSKNDLLLYIPEAEKIPETIDALKNIIKSVDQKVKDMKDEPSYHYNQVII